MPPLHHQRRRPACAVACRRGDDAAARSWLLSVMVALLVAALLAILGPALAPSPAFGQAAGGVPGNTLGTRSDAELWREIRGGSVGTVSIPNPQAGRMIQSAGESWRSIRNGPMSTYGVWALVGMIGLLAVFFLLRGRVRISAGPAARTIQRFNSIERFTHWLTAGSFILLGLSGLNLLYGRYVLLPVMGPEAFALLTRYGKIAHNYMAFAFMLGIVLMLLLWVKDNIPSPRDLGWFLKGGGLIGRHHPAAARFNAGQKIIFWLVILGGASISASGLSMMFPFELPMFAKTFAALNDVFGTAYPTVLSPVQEMQFATAWHGIVGLGMITVILAHIYIGSIGMEGAFAAMGSGQVDENWAREHHSLWVEDVMRKAGTGAPPGPVPHGAGDD